MVRSTGLFVQLVSAVALVALFWPTTLLAQEEPANLMQNPACDEAAPDGSPAAWSASWSSRGRFAFEVDRETKRTGAGSIRLANDAERGATFPRMFQRVELEANTRYLLSAWVRSTTGRANMQINPGTGTWFGNTAFGGAAGISASDEWRRVSKRFTTKEAGEATVVFTLAAPNREAVDLWVDSVSLVAEAVVKPPPPPPTQRIFPETTLLRDGQAVCAIVYPASPPAYRELAERIQQAIRAKTGAAPDILPDTAVTDERHPVLLEEYRDRNLILLGRLGINRAIWGVYNRFLCAVDGYYPGGDGYVVRTAANVYANGANSFVLGGSSDAGAERAVDRFLEILAEQPAEGGALTLPWLLDAELGGECKAVFNRDEAERKRAGTGSDSRTFYVNAMAYYWSGREAYLELTRESLALLLERMEEGDAISSHYGMEFFVRAWDMLDDSGLFDEDTVAAVDRAIVRTFRWYGGGRESGYRTHLPYDGTHHPMADHPNASWLADKAMADFILLKMPESDATEGVRGRALSRRALHRRTFDRLVRERWRGGSGYANTDVPMMTLFRYALEEERYEEFFDSGNARKAALYHLARTTPRGGDIGLQFGRTSGVIEWRLFLGIAASYYGDGELRTVMDAMRKRGRVHSDVYINNVHAYVPGDELPPEEPESLLGARAVPSEPTYHQSLVEAERTELPYEASFDLLTFRSGVADRGEGLDALLLTGGRDLPPNTLIRLVLDGKNLLRHTAEGGGHYAQNSLTIRRMSNWRSAQAEPMAELVRVANAPGAAYAHTRLPDYDGTVWDRRVVWLGDRFFAVTDTVTAKEADEYLVMANWRPGRGALESNRWVSGDGAGFGIAPASARTWELFGETDVNIRFGRETAVFRQRMTRNLAAGESVEIANLMFLRDPEAGEDWQLRRHPSGALMARAGGDGGGIYWLGGVPPGMGDSDAEMLVLAPDRAVVFHGRRLNLGGNALLESEEPVSAAIPLGRPLAAVGEALAGLWEQASAHPPADDEAVAQFPEDPAHVERAWRYDGAQRPGLVRGARQIERNTWDLGRVVSLAEISRRDRGGLPRLFVRTDPEGEWTPFEGETRTTGFVGMGGYGRITLVEDGHQTLSGDPQPARFVRARTGNNLPEDHFLFYDAASPGTSDPLLAVPADLRGTGRPDILVVPDIRAGFRVQNHLRHDLIVLDADGRERWRREMPWRMFFTPRALDWHGTGRKHVFVGSLDSKVHVFDADGEQVATLDPADTVVDADGEQVADQRTYGHPLPNDVGLWQPDETGRRKIVMPRYHAHSFFHRDGTVEGSARNRSGYWTTDTLPYGLDFTGDGVEGSVSMNSRALLPITQGSVGQETSLARGRHTGIVGLPQRDATLSGSPTLAFEIWGGEGTRLFVARENMVGIYQLAEGAGWTGVWAPDVPMTAAVALPEQRQILAASREGLLWRFQLDGDFEIASAQSVPFSPTVRRFVLFDSQRGDVLAATDAGLLRILPDNGATLLVAGDWRDVSLMPGPNGQRALLVDPDGTVEAYDIR